MPALIRLVVALFGRLGPLLWKIGTVFWTVGAFAASLASSFGSRLWTWGMFAASFLFRWLPLMLFFGGILLVLNLVSTLIAFVLYHASALLTAGLAPFVTVETVALIVNAYFGILVFWIVRLGVFLGDSVGAAVPVPSASPSGPVGISALKK